MINTLLQYRWVVITLLVLITAFFASYIPSTQFDASSDSLVLEGDTDLAYSRTINERYGAEDFLIITFAPNQDLFSPPVLQRLTELVDELAGLPEVSSVNSVIDAPLLYSPKVALSDLSAGLPTLRTAVVDTELVRQEFINSPIYRDLLTNADNSVTAVQVNLKRDDVYFSLLAEREALREKRNSTVLSGQESIRLGVVEQEFRDYSIVASERQARLVATVRQILKPYQANAEVFLGGVPMIAVDMIKFVKSDLLVFGISILAFIVVIMGVIFRSVRWVVLPLLTCVITAVCVTGWMAFVDWRMTVISSNFVAILLIVNLSVLIHLVVRYRELAAQDIVADQRELITRTLRQMALPCVYTALTTIVAFGSLVVSGIRPVIDFGWMMSLGVSVALIMSFLVLPLLLSLLPRQVLKKNDSAPRFTGVLAKVSDQQGGVVIVVSVILLAVSIWGVSRLQVENRFIDYFSPNTEIYRGMETIDRALGGTIPVDIIIDVDPDELAILREDDVFETFDNSSAASGSLDDDGFTDDFADDFSDDFTEEITDEFADDFSDEFSDEFNDEFAAASGVGSTDSALPNVWFTTQGLTKIKKAHDYLESQPEIGKVLSLGTVYEVVHDLLGSDVDDIQLALAQRSLPEDVQDVVITPYFDATLQQVRLSARVKETSHALKRDELIKKLRYDFVHTLGFSESQVQMTGMLVLYNNMLQSLFRSQILTLGAVFIAIMAMFFVLFRSIKIALIALAPNLLAASSVLGLMGILGIPLDLMTITIAAISVGMGVDHAIHYIYRFKAELGKDGDYQAALYRSHGSIGNAMFYTSVIIILGFGVLTLSNFTPSFYFGLLTGVAMLGSAIGSLLLLPQLLVRFKPI